MKKKIPYLPLVLSLLMFSPVYSSTFFSSIEREDATKGKTLYKKNLRRYCGGSIEHISLQKTFLEWQKIQKNSSEVQSIISLCPKIPVQKLNTRMSILVVKAFQYYSIK